MENILNILGLSYETIILDNTCKTWFWSLIILVLTLLIRKFLARWVIRFLFKLITKENKLELQFNNQLTQPIKRLILLFGILFAFEDTIFPNLLNFEISGERLQSVFKVSFDSFNSLDTLVKELKAFQKDTEISYFEN